MFRCFCSLRPEHLFYVHRAFLDNKCCEEEKRRGTKCSGCNDFYMGQFPSRDVFFKANVTQEDSWHFHWSARANILILGFP